MPMPAPYSTMEITVGAPIAVTTTIGEAMDYISYGCGNGYDTCGIRSIEVIDGATGLAIDFATHPFLNYDQATRTISAQSFSTLDTNVTLNITQKLVDYPDVPAHVSQVNITVVDACPLTTLDTFSDFSLTTGELLLPTAG